MPQHRFKKGEPRPANAGRKKGTPNKFTTVKQAFMDAMEEMGGKDFLKKVCKTQQGKISFMNNIARLLPTTEKVHHDHDLTKLTADQLRAILAEGEASKGK
jgi:hypothetical protein